MNAIYKATLEEAQAERRRILMHAICYSMLVMMLGVFSAAFVRASVRAKKAEAELAQIKTAAQQTKEEENRAYWHEKEGE